MLAVKFHKVHCRCTGGLNVTTQQA